MRKNSKSTIMPNNIIEKQYIGKKGEEYHSAVHDNISIVDSWISNKRKSKIKPYINNKDVILEYGVGLGWNLRSLSNKEKFGYDIATHLSTEVEKHGISFISDTSKLKDESFDVIICHHVLEHVSEPVKAINDINRLLKKNGKVLFFVPYEKEKIYHKYNPDEPNKHIYSWNVQTLAKLVDLNGFKIENAFLRKFGYDLFASKLAAKLKLGENGFLLLQKLLQIVRPRKEVFVFAIKE